jgi:hypothetical protein
MVDTYHHSAQHESLNYVFAGKGPEGGKRKFFSNKHRGGFGFYCAVVGYSGFPKADCQQYMQRSKIQLGVNREK